MNLTVGGQHPVLSGYKIIKEIVAYIYFLFQDESRVLSNGKTGEKKRWIHDPNSECNCFKLLIPRDLVKNGLKTDKHNCKPV